MAHTRLQELRDGQLQPVCSAQPLLLSTDSAWSGFLLERDVCRAGNASTIYYPHTSLVLVASGSIAVEDRALGTDDRFVAAPGSVTLWPAGYESRAISWTPECKNGTDTEMIRVQLDLSELDRLAPDDNMAMRQALVQQPGIKDPTLASLVRLMEAEVAAGCPAGPLFGESLCLALAVHISRRYAASPCRARSAAGGLSRTQVGLVGTHIQDHLGDPLSLAELAMVVGLSQRHFAVAFRKSIGVTPHQFVLRQRIEQARRLLAIGRMSIADVAATVGFASQSHFTDVFRKMAGTTPTQFRNQH